ncbi:MAG TPA: hypothetical protein ENH82_19440 [bacterium]|nr:hypothetical protein [bacterium]
MKPYEITKKAYRCLRCAHEWIPTKGKYKTVDEKPKRCPNCKSEYWDREKIRKAYMKEVVKK